MTIFPDLGPDGPDPYDDGPRGIGSMSPENDPVFTAIGICWKCSHRTDVYTCKAFPTGIPTVILNGSVLHTSPYPGDHGIQFDPA